MFQRYLLVFLRNPAWVAIGVIQPLLYLVLFAPLLKSLVQVPGFPAGGAYNVFVPGLLIQLGLFRCQWCGVRLIAECARGHRAIPRGPRSAGLRCCSAAALRDILTLVVQSLILLLLAIPFGLKPTVVGVIVMLGLVALIGLGIRFARVRRRARAEERGTRTRRSSSRSRLPLLLLSGVLLPLDLAPGGSRTSPRRIRSPTR